MPRIVMLIAAACLLGAAAAPAGAQGEFPLKYTDAQGGDPVLMMSGKVASALPGKPAELKAVPKDLSDMARYFVFTFGEKKVLAILDGAAPAGDRQSGGPPEGAPPQRLYLDTAGSGDLSAVQPLVAGDGVREPRFFGPVALNIGGEKERTPVLVRFCPYTPQHLVALPAGYMAGEVQLAGQMYRVAVVDNDLDGLYDKTLRLPIDRNAPPMNFDVLAMDLNQDGRFKQNLPEGSEVLPLVKMVQVEGAYYSIAVAPDGSSVRLEKANPKMGTLDVGTPEIVLAVISDGGFQRLGGSQGKWEVPAGKYATARAALERTDGAGAKWALTCSGEMGRLVNFEVPADGTLTLKVGPPLVAKIDAVAAGPDQMIAYSIRGQAGEQYAPAVEKDGKREPPPEFKVLDEAGKVITAGKFEYG